jgi:UDP-N-acetyl-D-mannosaminuronic acid dehydrogenase
MVYLLHACDWVATDSGGIQEEAVSLAKSVLVMRENTERPEGIWVGLAQLVGTDAERISAALQRLCEQGSHDGDIQHGFLYGDGYSAQKIAHIVQTTINTQNNTRGEYTPIKNTVIPATYMLGEKSMKKLCIMGLGYIGLPTALIAAEHGFQVYGVDIDAQRVSDIMQGNPVIDEPELFEKLQLALHSGTFAAATVPCVADYYIIAVPTPIQHDTTADISAVFSAADALVPVLRSGATVILESTVPVGTTQSLATYLSKKTGLIIGTELFVAHCPERVLPGNIVRELIDNARIIGGIDRACVDKAKEMYKTFVTGNLYLTDATTAEMVKLVENSSRDAQLAFAHQVASMAYAAGLNPYEVIELANKHPRVKILQPTCGVGGHCIAVDPWFLVHSFPDNSDFIRAARITNDNKPHEIMARIQQEVAQWHAEQRAQSAQGEQNAAVKTPTVLLLGLTYKPDVNDVRESPALLIAQTLIAQATAQLRHAIDTTVFSMQIRVCEPHLNKAITAKLVGDCVVSMTEGVAQADIIVYLVAHKRFAAFDACALQGKKLLDFCGILHKNRPETDQQEHLFWPASKDDTSVGVSERKSEVSEKNY